MAGIEVYDTLRDDYDIQIEFGDLGNILAYLSIGDRWQEVERLVSALAEIRRRYQKDPSGMLTQEYIDPVVAASPQEAFYAEKESLPLMETEGRICSECVIHRAFRFWHRENGLRKRFSNILITQRKRDVI